MKRAIATFGLIGLLSACLLAAADDGPAVAAGEPAGLCAASAPTSLELPGVPAPVLPVLMVTCSAVAHCSDGSQVSCYSGTWDLCQNFYACSYPYGECGVRCLNNFRFCPGYSWSTCNC